jgi:lysophospholipase L1-like esterase
MDAEKYYKFFMSMFSNEEKRNISRWLKGGPDAIYAGHELYNDAVKRVASAADVQMIDVSNAFHDTQKYLCVDGIHPNKAGQEKIAKTIAKAIL